MKTILKSASLLALLCAACAPTLAGAQAANLRNHPAARPAAPAPRPPAPAPRPPAQVFHPPAPAVRPPAQPVRPVSGNGAIARPLPPATRTPAASNLQATPPARSNSEVHTSSLASQHHWQRHDLNGKVHVRPQVMVVYQRVWPKYVNLQREADKLREAYLALSQASFDYNGYRSYAMDQTRMIASNLGITLQDDSSGDESKEASDAQMDLARDLLGQAYDGFTAKGYTYSARQTLIAVNQISAGLNEE